MSRVRPKPTEPASKTRRLSMAPHDLSALFKGMQTARDVASLLDVPYWQLTYIVYRSNPNTRYSPVAIRKKRGGVRNLLVPNSGLSALQTKLAQVLSSVYKPRECVSGFVANRSILNGARRHVRRTWVLNVDLREFFPSINFGRVRGMFVSRPYELPPAVATVLAQICCHGNQLPQGAPTSPIISNMICARLDGALLGLAQRHRLTYTRFADDITLSTSHREFPSPIAVISKTSPSASPGRELEAAVLANGFEINLAKCRLQGRRTRQEVTGIVVSRFPNVPREFVRRVRAMLHAWERHGYAAAEAEYQSKYNRKHRAPHRLQVKFRNVLHGHLAYLSMIRGKADPIYLQLVRRFAALEPGYKGLPQPIHVVVGATIWVLECDEAMIQGTAFALDGIGLVTCAHTLGSKSVGFRASSPASRSVLTVVARDDQLDLAVLQPDGDLGPSLKFDSNYIPEMGDQITAAGFPNYQIGDSGHFIPQRIVGFRPAAGARRALLDGPIAAGMSGGPVVDSSGRAVGVVVSGAEVLSQANMTERHGFIGAPEFAQFLRNNHLLK